MKWTLWILMAMLILGACGGGTTAEDELLGAELFEEMVVGGKAGCTSCHSVEPGAGGVGPSLSGIGAAAGSRVAGESATDYLKKSIVDPDAYLVDGYNSGVMPSGWDLSQAQIDSLVEYLLDL
jgi:mono/diheme cytochrome c family protein